MSTMIQLYTPLYLGVGGLLAFCSLPSRAVGAPAKSERISLWNGKAPAGEGDVAGRCAPVLSTWIALYEYAPP